MNTFTLLGIMVGVIFVGGVIWVLYQQHRVKQAVIGHIFATFYTTTGAKYEILCRCEGNQVDAPSKALSSMPTIKTYTIREDKAFSTLYPPGKPSFLQATVPTTAYYEGNPNPIVSRDPKDRMDPVMTPQVIHNIRDEKMTGLMVRFGEELERLQKRVTGVLNPKIMYILIIIAIIVGIISIIMTTNTSSQLARLARLWGI